MNRPQREKSLTTLLLTADRDLEDGTSVSPPIHQSVNHRIKDAEHLKEISVPMGDRYYTRRGNPTSSRLAKIIAELEGAETGIIAASGMGALSTAVLSLVRAGDHVIGQSAHYIGTNQILDDLLPRFGVQTTRVDQRNTDALAQAIRPNTRLILLETPVNPLMHLTDLREVARLAKPRGITTLCDNTFATPINQRPIDLGIDLVMHSVTKYIGGHHDLLAGALVGSSELVERIWDFSLTLGAIGARSTHGWPCAASGPWSCGCSDTTQTARLWRKCSAPTRPCPRFTTRVWRVTRSMIWPSARCRRSADCSRSS